jgi:DNA-binding MarR family transcriptional regulator
MLMTVSVQPSSNPSDMHAFPDHPTPWTAASLHDPLFLMSKVGSRGSKLLAEALKPLDLRPRHIAALRFLADNGGASQRDLVDGLWSDPSSVVTLLDDFAERGLAERRRNPHDRRAYSVHLTQRGDEVLSEALRLSDAVSAAVFERLSEEQRAELATLLGRIVSGDIADVA